MVSAWPTPHPHCNHRWRAGRVRLVLMGASAGCSCYPFLRVGAGHLSPLARYSWTAQWWDTSGAASPTTESSFIVGPITSTDWDGALWLGGGAQNDFALSVEPVDSSILLFVASPGGSILLAGDGDVKTSKHWVPRGDDVGLSPWIDNRKTVTHQARFACLLLCPHLPRCPCPCLCVSVSIPLSLDLCLLRVWLAVMLRVYRQTCHAPLIAVPPHGLFRLYRRCPASHQGYGLNEGAGGNGRVLPVPVSSSSTPT
jgi:hypothetical protein